MAASLTLTNVNMSNADKNELVDALTPVLADIVSDSLSESQELIEVVITAVNGQQVNSVRRLEVAGTLRADFVAIVEEMETCSGECEGDVGKPDQEVGDAILSQVTNSISNAVENEEGFLDKVREQSQSRGMPEEVFQNAGVDSVVVEEKTSVRSEFVTESDALVGFGLDGGANCRCYYERAVNVDGLEKKSGRGPVAGQAELAEDGSSWSCYRKLDFGTVAPTLPPTTETPSMAPTSSPRKRPSATPSLSPTLSPVLVADTGNEDPTVPSGDGDEQSGVFLQCTATDNPALNGLGCDGQDNNCDGEIDECGEDVVPPTISFKDGLSVEAVVNGDGVTTITSPVFKTVQEAASYLESVVEAEDDCALGLQVEVKPPSLGAQCENTEFKVAVTDPRCDVLVERVFLLTVDPYIPVVEISFDNSSVIESDDHYGVGNDAYLHIPQSDRYTNVGFTYTVRDGCNQEIQTEIEVLSNELEYDPNQSGMALVRATKDQRQSHGLRVFVEASRCADSSSPLCEPFSHIEVSPEDSFRYFQFNIRANDGAGNVGESTAYVVIIPQKYKDTPEDANFFADFIDGAPTASNVIETKTMMWDTSRDDPVASEFVSITVSKKVTGEMSMSGINVPEDEDDLKDLIAFLEAQLLAGLAGRRRLQVSEECVCTSSVRITSLSSTRRRRDQRLGRHLQAGGGALIEYEVILTCDGNCEEDEESTDEGSNLDPDAGSANNLADLSEGLSEFISSGSFVDEMKKAAEETTGMNSLASVAVESVAVSDEIQTTKETNAAIDFTKTISLPVQNFAELDGSQLDAITAALTKVLKQLACPQDDKVRKCSVSFDHYKTNSVAFGSSRRHLTVSRMLASEILSFGFNFSLNVVCPDSGCNVDSITSAMEETVSQVLTTSIANNELLSQVGDETNAVELLSGEITLEDAHNDCSMSSGSAAGSGNESESSIWYPVWGSENKCSDGPGMPLYMQDTSHYTADSLESCCKKHFDWDITGCIVGSGGAASNSGTNVWYIDWESFRCMQSCIASSESEAQGLNCGGLAAPHFKTFSTAEICCSTMVPWISTSLCTAESVPPFVVEGTGKFYVSYENIKCVKDCPVGGDLCGGIAREPHLTLYEDASTCCAQKLWWLGNDCVSKSLEE